MSVETIKLAYARAEPLSGDDVDYPWPVPTPLPSTLPAVEAFHPSLLPAELRPWALDIAERMQCPIDFVAIPAMVAAGSLIGRRVGIRPEAKTDWTEVGNLWGCIVGRPGAMKSPVVSEVLAPLKRLEARAAQQNEENEASFRKAEARYKLRNDAARARAKKHFENGEVALAEVTLDEIEEPRPPIEKRYITTDATVEKLGVICADNPMGVLQYRDELLTLFQELDREEKAAARGFLLTGWGGQDGYTFDRIGRGTIRVPAVNLSILGSAQPHRIGTYLRESLRTHDDGMVQRLQLLTWPDHDSAWTSTDRYPDSNAKTAAIACYERLANLTPTMVEAERDPFDDGDGVPFLRFTPEGVEQFVEWRSGLEEDVRGDDLPPYLAAHFSKYRGLIPRLALVFHLASGGFGPVPKSACIEAIGWAEYLTSHARRAYASMDVVKTDVAASILRKIRCGQLQNGFSERDVYRPGWSGLRDREAVSAALKLLADYDWLRAERVDTGGRPSIVWWINPHSYS